MIRHLTQKRCLAKFNTFSAIPLFSARCSFALIRYVFQLKAVSVVTVFYFLLDYDNGL